MVKQEVIGEGGISLEGDSRGGPREQEKLVGNHTDGASLEDDLGPIPNQPLYPHLKQHTNKNFVYFFF